jgi:hypothetical protein
MRVIALFCLLFGFMGMFLLDGQTFTHAVMGIIFGIVAIGCGLASTRKDSLGRIFAVLGILLVVFCAFQLPLSHERQKRFNARSREYHERNRANPIADFHALGLEDADEAKALLGAYKYVFTAQVSEDYWENMGPRKPSLHHFKATVIKAYKGDWNVGETVSFSYDTDMPALTVSNAFAGTNMLLLAYGHTSNEIPFGLGDFFLVDTNVEQVLQSVFTVSSQSAQAK